MSDPVPDGAHAEPAEWQLDTMTTTTLQSLLKKRGLKLKSKWHVALARGPDNQSEATSTMSSSKTKPKYCCVPLCHNYTKKYVDHFLGNSTMLLMLLLLALVLTQKQNPWTSLNLILISCHN